MCISFEMSNKCVRKMLGKKYVVLVVTALLLVTVPTLGKTSTNVFDDAYLWRDNARVAQSPNPLWFTQGHRQGKGSNDWTTVADRLRSVVQEENRFSDVFVDIMGNSHNNTIFVVLTNLDEQTTDQVLQILNPPNDVSVRFLKGVAPRAMLEKWYSNLDFEQLKKEIGWTGSVITGNGTILISVEKLSPDVIQYANEGLDGKVPPGVLVLEEAPMLDDLSQSDRIRPLEAGIRYVAYDWGDSLGAFTSNFLVTESGSNSEVALVSGHSVDINHYVWQNTSVVNDRIGHVTIDPSGPRDSDCAWVPLYNGVSAISEIWSISEVNVVCQMNSSVFYTGMNVEITGLTSGYQYGDITYLDQDLSSSKYTTLYDQTKADVTCDDGDSGAPVYNKYYEGGGWNANALGILVGTHSGDMVFSPVDNIEDDFDKDIAFNGAG